MAASYTKTGILTLKASTSILVALTIAGLFFTVLVYFYPGPAMGDFFWPVFAIFAIFTFFIALKLLINQPLLTVDKSGIKFYRSGILIRWNQFHSCYLADENGNDSADQQNLVITYFVPNQTSAQQIAIKIQQFYNYDGVEILNAINYFNRR